MEILDAYAFEDLNQARILAQCWFKILNNQRSHSTPGYHFRQHVEIWISTGSNHFPTGHTTSLYIFIFNHYENGVTFISASVLTFNPEQFV